MFRITVTNEHFRSSNNHECADQAGARRHAITSALLIAAEQVSDDEPFFGAEVTLHSGRTLIQRLVIAAGASPLKMGD